MPLPKKEDLLDAIEHADLYNEGYSLDDFKLRYYGKLPPLFLRKYDDLYSWLEFDKDDKDLSFEEKIELLKNFRGEKWAKMALNWIKSEIPPVIIISIPLSENKLYSQIGDGRGRVNFAFLFNKKVPVYHLIYDKMKMENIKNYINKLINANFSRS